MTAARTASKDHDERKDEILDAAQELFTQSGYDATPVSAIIDKLGVSKGTFYHYFDSKDELLDCLALRITNRILDRARESTKDEMDAVTKLNTFFSVAGRWKAANLGVILMLARAMYRDENIPLRFKITRTMVDTCAPSVADIVAEGVGEGVFDATFPEDVAELIFQIVLGMRESTAGLFLELDRRPELWPVIERKIAAFELAIERVLCAPKGSIHLADADVMAMFREQLDAMGDDDSERGSDKPKVKARKARGECARFPRSWEV